MLRVRFSILFAVLAIIGMTTTQCSKDTQDPNMGTGKVNRSVDVDAAGSQNKSVPLLAPILSLQTKGMASLVIRVCAGASGGAAGFSLQWMKNSDYLANGSQWTDNSASSCAASFSGNANSSRYSLAPFGCVDVRVGELLKDNGASSNCDRPLECGVKYVFRAFFHNIPGNGGSKSAWSPTFQASTWDCEIKPNMACTKTAGEWKNNPLSWPVQTLMLGTVSYTKVQLLAILNTAPDNNGLIALAHQTIAAKLNVAAGSPVSYVQHPLLMVDLMIGNLVVPPTAGGGSLTYATVNERMNYLANYNDGAIGPGHCF